MGIKMKCKDIEKLISEYIDGELEKPINDLIKEHIKICEKCLSLFESLEKTIFLSKKIYKKKSVPKVISKRIYHQIEIKFKK